MSAAHFPTAFERMLLNEGGYKLHTVPGDNGGMTFAGISRRAWPTWAGWSLIARGETPPADLVRDFYRAHFWQPLLLDSVESEEIAFAIFDFAVNAGTGTAVKLAQAVVGTTPDGRMGPITLAAINRAEPQPFVMAYALAKIARYRDIVTKDRSQTKFLLGWLNRTLKGLTA